MLKNYLLVAFRNLLKNKIYALINILGLAVGLCCFIFISLYIFDELSYDRYHEKADRIYRVTRDFMSDDGSVSLHLGHVAPPISPLLKNDFPDIEATVRIRQVYSAFQQYGEKSFYENAAYFAEEDIFKIFSIDVLQGNPQKALEAPFSMMLTDKMAEKYFGTENPIGKTIKVNRQFNLNITGVYKSFPKNSHFHPDFLVSFSTMNDTLIYGKEQLQTNWGNNDFATYLLFPKNYPVEKVAAQFPAFLDKNFGEYAKKNYGAPKDWKASQGTHLFLQKLTDIHLYSHLDSELESNGDINSIYILASIALFILLIACINFVNLSTARSANRAKEVGIRKVVGAIRPALIKQFLSESVLLTMIALFFALCLFEVFKPAFNQFTDKNISLNLIENVLGIFALLLLAVVVGLVAGSYPALFLSSFNPVTVLKGRLSSGAKNSTLRTVLVVIQFSISVILIICTGVVYQQLAYMKNKKLGFNKDHLVTMQYIGTEIGPKYEAFKNELLKNHLIKGATRSANIPSNRLLNSMDAKTQSGDTLAPTKVTIKFEVIDHDFVDTYQMKLLAGRNFSRAYKTDDTTAFIINEASAKMVGWKNPQQAINQKFEYGGRKGKIIGLLQDFHYEAMREPIVPLVFFIPRNDNFYALSVKLNGSDLKGALAHLEKTWANFLPGRPFEYTFLDESFAQLYKAEQKQGQIFMIFAGIAIFIACLGLFGLASFIAEQRTKEIGIRKVLGASEANIFRLLSKDFVRLVLFANLIAFPIAWYAMHQWLQDFAYRTQINLLIFILAALIALLISILTISMQVYKVARVNPVNILRNE